MYRYTGNSNFSVNESDPDSEPRTGHVSEIRSDDSEIIPLDQLPAHRRRKMKAVSRHQESSVLPEPIVYHDIISLRSPPRGSDDVVVPDVLAGPDIITSSGRSSGESKVPSGESKSDDADDRTASIHLQFDFPVAAGVVEDVLKLSDTGTYSVEERLLLYMSRQEFWCPGKELLCGLIERFPANLDSESGHDGTWHKAAIVEEWTQ